MKRLLTCSTTNQLRERSSGSWGRSPKNRRFTLSYSDVEDLLVERGVTQPCETVLPWCRTFGPLYTRSRSPTTPTTIRRAGVWVERALGQSGSNCIAYDSVRRIGGECDAIFQLPLLSNARQDRRFCYIWDGWQIAAVYANRELGNDGLSMGLDEVRVADRSTAAAQASCAAHEVARQARLAHRLGTAGQGQVIAGGQMGISYCRK